MKIIKEIIPYIVIIIAVVFIRSFIITPVMVDGKSMYPTLDNKDIVLLKKINKTINRNDIVVLKYKNEKLIKRVIGLPGETIKYESGKLYINGEKANDAFAAITDDFDMSSMENNKIPKNYYLVLGDNRNNSTDSRKIGFINIDDIQGTVVFRLFPLKKIGSI